jgi:hypothetical protein
MASSVKLPSSAIASSSDLRAILAATDISVSARTQGRTTAETEQWTICRLLATLNQQGRLRFPLKLIHGDRPDFELVQNRSSTGIEITEAISQDYAACLALAERTRPGITIDMSLFRPDSPRKTVEELKNIVAASRLTGPGWAGRSAETDWATFIEQDISIKQMKLAKAGFRNFQTNWLAIYDNLPLPNVNLAHAVALLAPKVAPLWSRSHSFHAVFIERGPVIVELTPSGSLNHVLVDLW